MSLSKFHLFWHVQILETNYGISKWFSLNKVKLICHLSPGHSTWIDRTLHCVKSVYIGIHSGPYFLPFGLNTGRYSVSLRIQSECGKIPTRITPNTDTFYAVLDIQKTRRVPGRLLSVLCMFNLRPVSRVIDPLYLTT